VVVITASDDDAGEPANDGEFTVTSAEVAGSGGLVVNYTVDGTSTATSGSDYTALSGTVTIAEGESTAVIAVAVIDDTEVENTETVIANLSASSDYQVGTPGTATVNITSEDVYVATIAKTTDGDEEGPVDGVFTVTLNQAVLTGTGGVEVGYSIDETDANCLEGNPGDPCATEGADYTAIASKVVTIADGASSATITIDVIDDGAVEPGTEANPNAPETVTAVLSDGDDYDLGAPDSAVLTIADNEVINSTLTLDKDSDVDRYSFVGDVINYTYTIENAGNVWVYLPPEGSTGYLPDNAPWVTLTDDQEEVTCPTQFGVILFPTDTLECTASHTVVQADLDNESLTNVAQAFAYNFFTTPSLEESNTDEVTATLLRPEAQIFVTADTAYEPDTNGQYKVTLLPAPVGQVDVTYDVLPESTATSGADYEALSGTVAVVDGIGYIDVVVIDEIEVETHETVVVQLTDVDNPLYDLVAPNDPVTVTIVDNDGGGTFSIDNTSIVEAEVNGMIRVTRTGGSKGAASVDYESFDVTAEDENGTFDYFYVSGTLYWADGEDHDQFIDLTVEDDLETEGAETFWVRLSNAQNTGNEENPNGFVVFLDKVTGIVRITDPIPIPTLSEWAMILMALMLGLMAAFSLQRRQTRH
jgi:hypothetical protein